MIARSVIGVNQTKVSLGMVTRTESVEAIGELRGVLTIGVR